jgi:hypothetical protein
LQLVKASSYLTNPRKGHRHPTPLHPLENRNSAPEIVVTNSAIQQTNNGGGFYHHPQSTTTSTLRRLHHGGLEERIQRAKAKVQVRFLDFLVNEVYIYFKKCFIVAWVAPYEFWFVHFKFVVLVTVGFHIFTGCSSPSR